MSIPFNATNRGVENRADEVAQELARGDANNAARLIMEEVQQLQRTFHNPATLNAKLANFGHEITARQSNEGPLVLDWTTMRDAASQQNFRAFFMRTREGGAIDESGSKAAFQVPEDPRSRTVYQSLDIMPRPEARLTEQEPPKPFNGDGSLGVPGGF